MDGGRDRPDFRASFNEPAKKPAAATLHSTNEVTAFLIIELLFV
jgi:hypothetical protein